MPIFILMILFMLATLGVLVAGVAVMAIGGKLDQKWSNRLMVMRVVCQGSAIAMLGLLFLITK